MTITIIAKKNYYQPMEQKKTLIAVFTTPYDDKTNNYRNEISMEVGQVSCPNEINFTFEEGNFDAFGGCIHLHRIYEELEKRNIVLV